MLLTIVGSIGGVSLNRDGLGRASRSHVKGASLGLDVVVVVIGAVLVTPLGDSALAGSGSGLGAGVLGVGYTLAINELISRTFGNFPIGCYKRVAVVFLRGILRFNGHFALVDGELAVNRSHIELRGDVVALSILHHGSAGHLIGVLVCIGTGDSSTQTLNSEGCALAVGKGGASHARNRMALAIIGRIARSSRYCYFVFLFCISDAQFTDVVRNIVVALVIGIAARYLNGIGDLALFDARNRARCLSGNAIAPHKAVTRDGNFGFGERRAIIGLARRFGSKRHRTLCDFYRCGSSQLHGRRTVNRNIGAHGNGVVTRVYKRGSDSSPAIAALIAVFNIAQLHMLFSLLLIFVLQIAAIVDGSIDRYTVRFAIVRNVFAGSRKARP